MGCPKAKCQMLLCVVGFFWFIDVQNTVKTVVFHHHCIFALVLVEIVFPSSRSCLWTRCFYLSVICCLFRDFIPLPWIMCTCVLHVSLETYPGYPTCTSGALPEGCVQPSFWTGRIISLLMHPSLCHFGHTNYYPCWWGKAQIWLFSRCVYFLAEMMSLWWNSEL